MALSEYMETIAIHEYDIDDTNISNTIIRTEICIDPSTKSSTGN